MDLHLSDTGEVGEVVSDPNLIVCPNCESRMGAGEPCPECEHTDGADCCCPACLDYEDEEEQVVSDEEFGGFTE